MDFFGQKKDNSETQSEQQAGEQLATIKLQMFTSGAGGDQKRAKRTVAI